MKNYDVEFICVEDDGYSWQINLYSGPGHNRYAKAAITPGVIHYKTKGAAKRVAISVAKRLGILPQGKIKWTE